MTSESKILELDLLEKKADELRNQGKKLVLCHGTFDLIHVGHIRHLQRAREEGDALFVTLTADAFVSKGPGRPVFNEMLRCENMAALECVDYVGLIREVTAIPAIRAVKPHIFAKGSDYQKPGDDITGNILKERNAVEEIGGQTVYTDEITFSSSKLLNAHFSVFPSDVKDFLRHFGERYTSDQVIDAIKALENLNICVVGDAIVDEYNYTENLGQTGKGNIFAVEHKSSELFAGGSLAVANHISGFCSKTTLVTGLGERNSYESFIRSKLAPNIDPIFFFREDAPTILKSRYVDPDAQKLFEVYDYEDKPPARELELEICQWLERNLGSFDAVIVPDFGNGFITDAMAQVISKHAKFLAVNTQINSGTRGYHTVNRYPRVDYVSLNEPELRLAVHNRYGPLEEVAQMVAERVQASFITTTMGARGLVMRSMQERLSYQVPALSIQVVDRVGAGDAFLSISGICLGGGMAPEMAAFAGAAAAALDVRIMCNREAISPTALFKYMVTLLK